MASSHTIKQKQVDSLAEKIKNSKTLMIVSIKSLPSKQFQDIKKSIREQATIQVAKKNILIRALKAFGKESILQLDKHIDDGCAFAISNTEGYELAGLISKNKTPVFAKAGQEAPEDIEVKDGPTDLMPGPAISELGALGLQVAVEDGKISIKKSKVVINKGQTINAASASILQKLNIQPFTIGLEPVAIYDIESEKIYTDIKIDPEETATNLRESASKALGFAQKIAYYAKETIGYLLAKANTNAEHLNKLQPSEETHSEETKTETPSKESKETEEKPKEESKDETPSEESKTEDKPKEQEK
ncbi:50S ribosomal protein L10 [archaeon]|jgi:ribosomal protein L10|nr:50S ribosomal protein L10 [archaeon]